MSSSLSSNADLACEIVLPCLKNRETRTYEPRPCCGEALNSLPYIEKKVLTAKRNSDGMVGFRSKPQLKAQPHSKPMYLVRSLYVPLGLTV